MKSRARTVLSGGVTAVVVIAASYVFAVVQSDTPEKLIAELQRAANHRDVETFLSYLTAESRKAVESSYVESASNSAAQEEFQKALDEKFGKGTDWIPDVDPAEDLTRTITRITAAEVISKTETPDGLVELKVRTNVRGDGEEATMVEQTVGAEREKDEWKLSLGYPEMRPDAEWIKKEFARIAAEVRDGKYEDRVAAMIALDNAIRKNTNSGKLGETTREEAEKR